MPSDSVSATLRGHRQSRRRVLATLGAVASVSTAGCGDALLGNNTRSSDESGEVVVENRTTSEAEIAVRMIGSEDETLFSRVFALGPNKWHRVARLNLRPRESTHLPQLAAPIRGDTTPICQSSSTVNRKTSDSRYTKIPRSNRGTTANYRPCTDQIGARMVPDQPTRSTGRFTPKSTVSRTQYITGRW